ncbi:hypothetical protein SAMN05444157_1673 [Frankineae bacterium MT45]|nr:hypothetical protein SAMN05444157_1673 [Frankineae bacterium MT45]
MSATVVAASTVVGSILGGIVVKIRCLFLSIVVFAATLASFNVSASAAPRPRASGVNVLGNTRGQAFLGDVIGSRYADRITLGGDASGCYASVEPGRHHGSFAPARIIRYDVPTRTAGACPDMGTAIPVAGRTYSDIAVTWFYGAAPTSKSVYVLRNFTVRTAFAAQFEPSTIGAADFNGDGVADLWESTDQGDGFRTYLSSGTTFVAGPMNFVNDISLPLPAYSFGQLDGEPGVDVAAAYFAGEFPQPGWPNSRGNGVLVAMGGSGAVTVLETDDTGYTSYATSLADVNHDGSLDLLVRVTTAQPALPATVVNQVWLNDGTGHFTLRST